MRPRMRACGGNNRIIASDVTDLPEPDSPTSPNVPDSGMLKLKSRTADTSPVCVAKLTFKCSTFSKTSMIRGHARYRCKTAPSFIVSHTAGLLVEKRGGLVDFQGNPI